MRLGRSLVVSYRALVAHKIRASLALASVSAGVAAVILTSAVGVGVERDIQRNIDNLGPNLLVVRPAEVRRFVARKELRGTVTTLDLADYEAIAQLPLVSHAAPGVEASIRLKAGPWGMTTMVLGTTPEFPLVRHFRVERGRFLTADDDRGARRVAVLGARVASELFVDVGQQLRVRGVPFDVIGVLASKGVLAGGDEDSQVFIPVRTALRRVLNTSWLNVVFVSAQSSATMIGAQAQIDTLLRQRHRALRDGRADFEIQNVAGYYAMETRTTQSLRVASTSLATITLVVGGSGIMALMLLSVRERTSEIGLRIAVGATPGAILLQFLLEATSLALGGWLAGVAVGAAGAGALAAATEWPVAAPARAILMSLGMAVGIGLTFGAIPARNASRIPPLRALLAA